MDKVFLERRLCTYIYRLGYEEPKQVFISVFYGLSFFSWPHYLEVNVGWDEERTSTSDDLPGILMASRPLFGPHISPANFKGVVVLVEFTATLALP